ncbi:MAG: glycoside hydrolase family 31 protein [Bacilli bacterium]|nr:glycoside hydrolase family 31 protein [Bacilli bacterium]
MYNLGEHFKFDLSKAKASEKAIFQGQKYRITVLTERLLRLEYNEDGLFEDYPTQLVWNRLFEVPEFKVKEDNKFLEITTKYFKLYYVKEKKFYGGKINPTANLKVELLNTERFWYYKHPEVRNYGMPTQINSKRKKIKFKKGLFSADGFASIDDSNSYLVNEMGNLFLRENQRTDIYIFMYYNDFYGCLNDYYKLTSYPSLLPRYALGNWWSKNETYNDITLRKLIDDFDYNHIPMSVLLLNKDWHKNTYDNKQTTSGFVFNKDLFKAPYDMISYVHSKGIRIGLNVDPTPGFYPFEEYYEKTKEYIQTEGNIIPFNVMDNKTVDVYLKLFIHPLDALDVDFYWLDLEHDSYSWFLVHYHFFDMMRNYKRRPMVLTKNIDIAPHRYPVLYSGKTIVSWDTLSKIPFYNLSATNMGISYWSHDVGGYHFGIEDNELYTRFVQLGVFSPILKFGAEKGKYYKREPWLWGVKTYEIVKNYLTLRHRLIPYLYTEAYKYATSGKPVIEPLFYKYPEIYDDIKMRNEYYLGSQLFISPIVTKKDYVMNRVIHKFYIPDGIWYDFVTGKKFPGNNNYVAFFKDNEYPVFARSGSIIVMGENDNINDTTPPKHMEVQIFPGKSNQYELYEDDGLSDLYKKGFYLKTLIEYNYLPSNYTVIIRAKEGKRGIVPDKRNYKIRFRNTKKANQVITYFNDIKIDNISYVDGTDFIVEVSELSTIGQLTINCKGKDIEIDAIRIINDDIESIISDLQIETTMKETIDAIIFSDLPIKKKRIEIRKLSRRGLERKFIKLFLKLLEYVGQV